MDYKKVEVSLIALGSGAELTAAIFQKISGNDISTSFGDRKLDDKTVIDLALSRFNSKIAAYTN